jgi:DNA-binding beta-propeller fold protein YncE
VDVFESFDKNIASIIRQFDSVGLLKRQSLNLSLETKKENDSLLSFPGGILADESSEKLFISDTGNNRIIIASLDGSILDICGSGDRGILDGSFDIAKFNQPHGLALSNNILYIADTGNHCIRAVNLSNRKVTTLAGNGRQGKSLNIRGKAHLAGLNSPWDLEVIDDKLFVTMAGAHQLYRIDLQNKTISLFAGSGFEDRLDGSQFKAALAQPSGLATDGKRLYFTDSQSSSVRWIDGRDNSVVTTIVGLGLFQFGDRDGRGPDALLQYPTGLTYYNDLLYVADTYNNKIKVIDLFISSSRTFLGNGTAGNADNPVPLFNEPGDVSYALGMLFIADTNNHLIRIADIKTAKVTTLELKTIPKD